MKKIFSIAFIILLFAISANAQNTFQFTSVKHNFGKIKQSIPVSYTFLFKNISNKPLIVEVATAECGCTTPDYPKEPITKGKDGKIKATFNAESAGTFSKKITVKFANVDDPVILTIEGEVMAK